MYFRSPWTGNRDQMNRTETVETITAQLDGVPMEPSELPQFLMMYVTDPDYDRAGICEAEKVIKRQRGWQ